MYPSDRVTIPGSLQQDDKSLLVMIGNGRTSKDGDVWLVAYKGHHTTSAPRGENTGKTLTGCNMVRGIWHLGTWNGAALDARAPATVLPKGTDHVAVLFQAEDQGPIYGAAAIALRQTP